MQSESEQKQSTTCKSVPFVGKLCYVQILIFLSCFTFNVSPTCIPSSSSIPFGQELADFRMCDFLVGRNLLNLTAKQQTLAQVQVPHCYSKKHGN